MLADTLQMIEDPGSADLPPEPEPASSPPCRICGSETYTVGTVHGRYSDRDYRLARCPTCHFAFVADPWLDYGAIYDADYYAGRGADPLVDYHFELSDPSSTIRRYEWQGIGAVVDGLLGGPDPSRRWLDYGCGNGGLVRYLRRAGRADATGFDSGAIVAEARGLGIPILDADGLATAGPFDVVTAIEVIEHTLDPVAELRAMRRLLRPGGLLFLTTGNARPYADRLLGWRYLIPEIHISLFEPVTLDTALTRAGFRPEHRPLGAGFDQIVKFKVLKNLRVRRRSPLTDLLPAALVGPLGNRLARLSEHPIGWAA
jgi:SAM-dependent methyltransferase